MHSHSRRKHLKTPYIFALEAGLQSVHLAEDTYSNEADTKCGIRVKATFFWTGFEFGGVDNPVGPSRIGYPDLKNCEDCLQIFNQNKSKTVSLGLFSVSVQEDDFLTQSEQYNLSKEKKAILIGNRFVERHVTETLSSGGKVEKFTTNDGKERYLFEPNENLQRRIRRGVHGARRREGLSFNKGWDVITDDFYNNLYKEYLATGKSTTSVGSSLVLHPDDMKNDEGNGYLRFKDEMAEMGYKVVFVRAVALDLRYVIHITDLYAA